MDRQEQVGGQGKKLSISNIDQLPEKLYRRTAHEFARGFLESGEVRFKPLTYYWGSEGLESVWMDDEEGRLTYNFPHGTIVDICDPKSGRVLAKGRISTANAKNATKLPHWFHIFCMSTNGEALPLEFGPSLIVLHEPAEFFRRLSVALKKIVGSELEYGRVKYHSGSDPAVMVLQPSDLWQYKRAIYSDEFEYRFCTVFRPWDVLRAFCRKSATVRPKQLVHSEFSLSIKVGNLQDIVQLIEH